MVSVKLDLGGDLAALLGRADQPVEQVARELIVLELYRQRTISSGKAAELLGVSRQAFIERASELGIPFFAMSNEEWEAERRASETL